MIACSECKVLKKQLAFSAKVEKDLRKMLDKSIAYTQLLERKVEQLTPRDDDDFKIMHG